MGNRRWITNKQAHDNHYTVYKVYRPKICILENLLPFEEK